MYSQPQKRARALQVASVLLTDSVPFRFNWPRSSDLRINNMQYRPYTRNNSTKLGDNARDEPATVGQMISSSGRNRVALACIEEREPFCECVACALEGETRSRPSCPAVRVDGQPSGLHGKNSFETAEVR